MAEAMLIAKNGPTDCSILPSMLNRHGLITGATGTGKTVTLQKMTEVFSSIGVPVFLADIKGDLSGLAASAEMSPKLAGRLKAIGVADWEPVKNPVVFWDVFGEAGHPVRAAIADMGPLLMSRLLSLNATQSGVLAMIFKIAADENLPIIDLKDLRAVTQYVANRAKEYSQKYGNIATASVGAIQRGLLTLDSQGGNVFFGEPSLDIRALMRTSPEGRGLVNILSAVKLVNSPMLYVSFLLWLMNKLFDALPEAGDLDKPKIVFFFDEAHLLFNDAPPELLDRVSQLARLIRSKGVGIFFVTQSPLDIPENVLGQLGNRVQHALRAYTPKDQKAVKTVAKTMCPNPAIDTEKAISELGVGEALLSFLDEKGVPGMVQRAFILAPGSRIGVLRPEEFNAALNASPYYGQYETPRDDRSAYEILNEKLQAEHAEAEAKGQAAAAPGGIIHDFIFGSTGPRGGRREGVLESTAKSLSRSYLRKAVNSLGGAIFGSVFGSGKKKK